MKKSDFSINAGTPLNAKTLVAKLIHEAQNGKIEPDDESNYLIAYREVVEALPTFVDYIAQKFSAVSGHPNVSRETFHLILALQAFVLTGNFNKFKSDSGLKYPKG